MPLVQSLFFDCGADSSSCFNLRPGAFATAVPTLKSMNSRRRKLACHALSRCPSRSVARCGPHASCNDNKGLVRPPWSVRGRRETAAAKALGWLIRNVFLDDVSVCPTEGALVPGGFSLDKQRSRVGWLA